MCNKDFFFHCSPCEIAEITNDGMFGSFLFFSPSPSGGLGKTEKIYRVEIDRDRLLDDTRAVEPEGLDAEASWAWQRERAELARADGYLGIVTTDEKGHSYMIDCADADVVLVDVTERDSSELYEA